MIPTSRCVSEIQNRDGVRHQATRTVAEEVPVAFSFGGSTHAVMMASPGDIGDFAYGFCLTEGIIGDVDEILSVDIVEAGGGYDVQIELVDDSADALRSRRRQMAGPVGCGLCGIESIEQAVRPVQRLPELGLTLTPGQIAEAVRLLGDAQVLNRETRAVHGAGFYVPGRGLTAIREDVGRHNALDKLVGAVCLSGGEGAVGAVVVTSRLSIEMVQKVAMLGSPVLIAISAPTALAIRTAEGANITLVAVARGDDFEIFTRPGRIVEGAMSDVA